MDKAILIVTQQNRKSQLIHGDGTFNSTGLENFIDMVKLGQCGLSYVVVSTVGPQSGGKRTLVNHVFGTDFVQMDASRGRSQTTNGVWLSNAVGIEPLTLVMDLEGNYGRECGEDGAAFEKQIALFALAVSDVMLINMWYNDVGHEQAANKPLLRTIFEVYMTNLFHPAKATLVFVIQDRLEIPVELLEAMIREDIRMIWDAVPKPTKHKKTPLSEFFNVQFVALPCPLYMKEQFIREVARLKQLLCRSITCGGHSGDQRCVPASGFLFSCQQIWESIQENKDLDLPKHKDLVANKRCEEIADEVYSAFLMSEEWCQMNDLVQSGPVPGFGKKLRTVMQMSLERYESETTYFDECIRSTKKRQLLERLLLNIAPAFQKLLGRIKRRAFEKFREELDKAANRGGSWDSAAQSCTRLLMAQFNTELEALSISIHTDITEAGIELPESEISLVRKELQSDIDAHIDAFRRGLPPPEIKEPKNLFKKSSVMELLLMSLSYAILPIFGIDVRKVLNILADGSSSGTE